MNPIAIGDIFVRLKEYGAFFVRFAFGVRLIYGTKDHLFDYEKMLEFADYLASNGFPLAFFAAVLTISFQFTCGLLWVLGYKVRLAGFLMAINFTIALLGVHFLNGHSYLDSAPALHLLAVSLFLTFNGAGKFSFDEGLFPEKKLKSQEVSKS